jgi:enterochelin esterase-like enzyme
MPRDRIWTQPSEDKFGEAVIDLLLPYIDEQYRTRAEQPYRAIGGLSRGASWAIHLGFSRRELFSAIGGHSPPVFWEDVDYIEGWIKAIPPDQLPRIYLDIGRRDREEIMVSAIWFEELLTKMNIPHEWHLFTGYHNEEYWSSHIEEYLRWYAQEWGL